MKLKYGQSLGENTLKCRSEMPMSDSVILSCCSDPYLNIMGLHPEALRVFENIQDITGSLVVQGHHPDFTNLSYFKSLSRIRGKKT